MSKAYAIMDVEIHDPGKFQGYMAEAQVAIKAAEGQYLVRGGTHKVLEGEWPAHRLVMVAFPSIAAAEGFYASDVYQSAMTIRHASSTSKIVLVEGVPDQPKPEAPGTSTGAKAYVLFDVNIIDMARYQDFMQLVKPAIEAAGGTYLVRGAEHKVLEGDWNPDRLVIFEFPSVEAAEAFYFSDEYQNGAKKIRDECSTAKVVVVEGFIGEQPA